MAFMLKIMVLTKETEKTPSFLKMSFFCCFRFIIDDAALYLSDKVSATCVDLKKSKCSVISHLESMPTPKLVQILSTILPVFDVKYAPMSHGALTPASNYTLKFLTCL